MEKSGSIQGSYGQLEKDRPYSKMDSQELTRQYSPSQWSQRLGPDKVVQDHVNACSKGSEMAKSNLKYQTDIKYGPGYKQKLDIFTPHGGPKPGAPIYVYIHGGYWQELGREISSFAAPHVVKAGGIYIAVGYDLAPQASMTEMVNQVKQAMLYVIKYAMDNHARSIYIGGHSAGGHLAAMMMSQNWDDLAGSGANELIKGAVLVSGVYDLRPIVDTYVNDPIKMTPEEAFANSPWNPEHLKTFIHHHSNKQVLVCVGQHDSPEFRRLTVEYEQVLRENGVQCRMIDVPNRDHFDVIDRMYEADHPLTQSLLELMGLPLKP